MRGMDGLRCTTGTADLCFVRPTSTKMPYTPLAILNLDMFRRASPSGEWIEINRLTRRLRLMFWELFVRRSMSCSLDC